MDHTGSGKDDNMEEIIEATCKVKITYPCIGLRAEAIKTALEGLGFNLVAGNEMGMFTASMVHAELTSTELIDNGLAIADPDVMPFFPEKLKELNTIGSLQSFRDRLGELNKNRIQKP